MVCLLHGASRKRRFIKTFRGCSSVQDKSSIQNRHRHISIYLYIYIYSLLSSHHHSRAQSSELRLQSSDLQSIEFRAFDKLWACQMRSGLKIVPLDKLKACQSREKILWLRHFWQAQACQMAQFWNLKLQCSELRASDKLWACQIP